EVLDVMQRRTIDVVTPALEPYYRDVYDHVLRATDFLDSLRDNLGGALDAYLGVVSNRLNEVMKQLTSWAAIILIPTLIAGIYGMNFVHMPELRWRFGYAYALALMFGAGFLLYRMFKRRDWL
ncbi:MAG TPA: CorA family divalent cation transporter, partial [Actinomycetota bacterium]|nr:CorA family divalent cation transporter [Actinomycetota bacterium]